MAVVHPRKDHLLSKNSRDKYLSTSSNWGLYPCGETGYLGE